MRVSWGPLTKQRYWEWNCTLGRGSWIGALQCKRTGKWKVRSWEPSLVHNWFSDFSLPLMTLWELRLNHHRWEINVACFLLGLVLALGTWTTVPGQPLIMSRRLIKRQVLSYRQLPWNFVPGPSLSTWKIPLLDMQPACWRYFLVETPKKVDSTYDNMWLNDYVLENFFRTPARGAGRRLMSLALIMGSSNDQAHERLW